MQNGLIKIKESPEYSYMRGLSREGYQPVYRNGMFGIRIEDTFHIKKNSCIKLGKTGNNYTIIKIST